MPPVVGPERGEVQKLYFLVDPRNDEIRYVGLTKNPQRRLSGHRMERGHPVKRAWIFELARQGLKPRLVVCGEASYQVEAQWTRVLGGRCKLLNRTGTPWGWLRQENPYGLASKAAKDLIARLTGGRTDLSEEARYN